MQYQETWDDESGASYKTDDLILTPEVKGHVEFYLKYKGRPESYNTWKPSLNIYECTDNYDFSYSKGEEIVIDPVTIPTDSWVKVSLDVDDRTILGLRLENVYFDSFSAEVARIPQVQYLQLSMFTSTNGYTVYADENGNAELKFKVNVINRGNIPITTAQDDFSIDLQNGAQVIGTFPIDVDMQPADVIEFEFGMPWKLKKITEAEVLNLQLVENISRHVSSTAITVRVEVFAPILSIASGDAAITEYLDLGVYNGRKTMTFDFANLGGKELNLTSITMPDGISCDFAGPTTIAPHAKVPVTITFPEQGAIAGNIEIVSDGINPSPTKIHYYGAGVADGVHGATFDGQKIPARWLLEHKDAWIGNNRIGEAMRSSTSKSTSLKLISPLMAFAEGGKATMSLGRWATWTESTLTVYVSDDRINWTEISTISSKDENTAFPATQWEFAPYEVAIPAGNKYIAVSGLYANIDNLTGGVLVDVDQDVYVHDIKADATGMVNYPMSATLTVQNLGVGNLGPKDYAVEVYIDGELVGKTENGPALSNNAEKASDIAVAFTPHKAVEQGKLTARLVAGDYAVESKAVDVTINAEAIDASKVIGSFNADRTNSNIPMRTGDNNSYSEFIYTAEQLGIAKGEKLTAIGFPYRITADRVAEKNVRIWAQLTDTEKALRPDAGKAFDTSDMTLVFEKSVTLTKTTPDGVFSNFALLNFAFDKPFEYDGRNIRFIIETKSSAFIASEFMTFAGGNTVFVSSDNPINTASVSPDLLLALPVSVISLDKEAVAVTGKLCGGDGALAGVTVTFKSGDVLYDAVTADDGAFSVAIMQTALSYEVSAIANGYKDLALAPAVYASATDLGNVEMEANAVDAATLVVETDAESKSAIVKWQAVVPGSADESVAYDIYLDGEKVGDGVDSPEYTLENLSDGAHKVGVSAVFAPANVATAPAEAEFTIETASEAQVIASKATITAGEGYIAISVAEKAKVCVYATGGLMVYGADMAAGTETIAVAPGVYLVTVTTASTTTAKVAVK